MTMTLRPRPLTNPVSPADRLRGTTAAVRVSFTWFGVRKALTPQQKNQAAEAFSAEGDCLSAGKKLLDTRHSAYKEVTGIRGKVQAYWKSLTLPFPEPGIRLIRQDRLDAFNVEMNELRSDLMEAVERLEGRYGELKEAARRRLGELFCSTDYPPALRGLFDVDWDFPNVEPPSYLWQLNPELFEQEKLRVSHRFQEAVELAEQAFLGEFAKLVSHLTERLSSGADGEKKVFRDTAVTNLTEFFGRFRELSVQSNGQLEDMVSQVQRLVRGITPQTLRDSDSVRQQIATQMASVQASIDGMMVDRPRRVILRDRPMEGSD